MSIISRAADTYYTYRFLSTLVTKWEDTEAYRLGIIDENGKNLIKARDLRTKEEKDSYTVFHRLVFNLKRLIEKVPLGKSRIASYAAALFLLKEETGFTEEEIRDVLNQMSVEIDELVAEDYKIIEEFVLAPGVYTLKEDMATRLGNIDAKRGTEIIVPGNCEPVDTVFGQHIYKVAHKKLHCPLYVTSGDITR